MGHENVQRFLCIPAASAVAVAVDDNGKAVLASHCSLLWLVMAALQLEASLAHLVRQARIFRCLEVDSLCMWFMVATQE